MRPRPPARCDGQNGASDRGIGRSRGGLTSKIHALVDANGRPVALRLTGGQVHDAREAEVLLEALPEGATLLADKGYDSNAIRDAAASRNAWANIPSRSNRKQQFAFSPWLYRQRNLVERFFKRIKHFRGIAIRYDKCPGNYLAAVNSSALASGVPRNESTPEGPDYTRDCAPSDDGGGPKRMLNPAHGPRPAS